MFINVCILIAHYIFSKNDIEYLKGQLINSIGKTIILRPVFHSNAEEIRVTHSVISNYRRTYQSWFVLFVFPICYYSTEEECYT